MEKYFDDILEYLERDLKTCQESIHSNPEADSKKFRDRGYEAGMIEAAKYVDWVRDEYLDERKCSHCEREYA